MLTNWSRRWTYAVVEEFFLLAEEIAEDREKAIEEMRHLLTVINISGYNLSKAATIISEHADSQARELRCDG